MVCIFQDCASIWSKLIPMTWKRSNFHVITLTHPRQSMSKLKIDIFVLRLILACTEQNSAVWMRVPRSEFFDMSNFRELMHLLVEKDHKRSDRIVNEWIDRIFTQRCITVILEDEKSKSNGNIFGEKDSITSNSLIQNLDDRIREFSMRLNLPKVDCK